MPPAKRERSEAILPQGLDESPSTGTSKRQRVSLACDGCRAAREKCDGGRPQCATCVSQSRACSYTPASKKRGVQSGYLRTIETSLAWLFDQVPASEEALRRLLTYNGGSEARNVLVDKGQTAARLHKKWTKSRVQRDIVRLLSNGQTQTGGASEDDSETSDDHKQEPAAFLAQPQTAAASLPTTVDTTSWTPSSFAPRDEPAQTWPKLPSNWQRLIEVYFSYTHCWLPILEKDEILACAALYDSDEKSRYGHASTVGNSRHAELWAALAVASFQDSHSSNPPVDPDFNPEHIFGIARGLIPPEDGEFDIAMVNAILLHSILFIGRQNELAASLLVGKASRLLLHWSSTKTSNTSQSADSRLKTTSTACAMLDVVSSLCVRLRPSRGNIINTSSLPLMAEKEGLREDWTPVRGFGLSSDATVSGGQNSQPYGTLEQLSRFVTVLKAQTDITLQEDATRSQAEPEDLVRCLSSPFSFCNSLISTGSTPVLPSAYLVKIMFLAATIRIIPNLRASLLSSFLEVVESCVVNFGACGTPPLVIGLIRMVQKHASLDEMHASERTRWNTTLSLLSDTWTVHSIECRGINVPSVTLQECPTQASLIPLDSFSHELLSPDQKGKEQVSGPQSIIQSHGLFPASDNPPGIHETHGYRQPIPSPTAPIHGVNMSLQPTSMDTRQPAVPLQAKDALSQPIDYDAMLEELGTIDYTDSIGMDPQFMMNLGFAPGCDVGEMFQGDFSL